MELTLRIISIALSSFALGFSLCGLLYSSLTLKSTREKKPKKKKNPHKPLKREEGETSEAFIERVQQKLKDGELTPNAARRSLGFKPIEPKADGFRAHLDCTTCRHIARKGWNGPCQDCFNFNEWEPRG